MLLSQAESRVPELVPVRHGRMLVSPFTYYRGAALPMAADLATTPTSGLRVQLCGDAHLSNFGAFGSPERKLVFDLNDFDETLPGSFEWDVKRLAASLVVAGRDNGFTRKQNRKSVLAAVSRYRDAHAYVRRAAADDCLVHPPRHRRNVAAVQVPAETERFKSTEAALAKARTRDSTQALSKLTAVVGGERRIISDPPLIVPVEEVFSDRKSQEIYDWLDSMSGKYRRTLQSDRRHLLEQFTLVQAARKVVGVGSVGTRAWILLWSPETASSRCSSRRRRRSPRCSPVSRAEQVHEPGSARRGRAAPDAGHQRHLPWLAARPGQDGVERDYYIRQLRDWKFSLPIEQMPPSGMAIYAGLCGWTLARAHARSGDRVALAAYLGSSDKFDNAIADFAETYADQNERDHGELSDAVRSGRAEAQAGL